MTITFKEFKNNVQANATVFLGSFRFDEADKTRGREVSVVRFVYKEKYNCWDASQFFSLPLADSYQMDVYTDYYADGWGSHYVNEKSAVELLSDYLILDACEKDEQKRNKAVRRTLGFTEKAFAKFLSKEGFANGDEYLARLEHEAKAKAAAERAEKAAEKKRVRDIDYVNSHIFYENGEPVVYGAGSFIERNINTGTHVMYRTCAVGNENSLTCEEENDYNGYSRRCQFTMIRRGFRLTVKKGYIIRLVGGLITFYRGEFKRDGMACEWVEQGRAIADIER